MEDRRHQITASEHILILQIPAIYIFRELIEHGANQRRTIVMRLLIELLDIVMHGKTDVQIRFHDAEAVVTIAPQFIGLPRTKIAAATFAVIQLRDIVRPAVAMHAQHG